MATTTDTAVSYFIAVPGYDHGALICGIGTSSEGAVTDAYDQSNSHAPVVWSDEDHGTFHVRLDTGEDNEFNGEDEAREYAEKKGFVAIPCTERLYRKVLDFGAPSRWTTNAAGLQDLDEAETDIDAPAPAAKHLDPNDTAVAAILSLDLDPFDNNHHAIAAALAPHAAAAPSLREWDCDNEWTAAEEAVSVVRLFIERVASKSNPDENDQWWRCQNTLDRLRFMQSGHRKSLVYDRLGTFPGYTVRIDEWMPGHPVIRIYPSTGCTDLATSMFTLDKDATRREVELSIAAWKAGHERGLIEGRDIVKDGIKALLDIAA